MHAISDGLDEGSVKGVRAELGLQNERSLWLEDNLSDGLGLEWGWQTPTAKRRLTSSSRGHVLRAVERWWGRRVGTDDKRS